VVKVPKSSNLLKGYPAAAIDEPSCRSLAGKVGEILEALKQMHNQRRVLFVDIAR
jgi:hypothetical protein